MYHGRNEKIRPMGFDTAVTVYTRDFSPEAAANFAALVKDVARKYDYSDAAALTNLKRRLGTAARRTKTKGWAQEVLDHLTAKKEQGRNRSVLAATAT